MLNFRGKLFFALIFAGATFGCIAYVFYSQKSHVLKLEEEYALLKSSIDQQLQGQKKEFLNANASKAFVTQSQSMWLDIQKKVKDTVVQVFADVAEFNWIEPYKTPKQGASRGSGFFINNSGDIITNYHVVSEATSIQIQISSLGLERFDAEIVGVGPARDIALLRLTSEDLKKVKEKLKEIPYLVLGDSDQIMRSQEVLALGYPLGQSRLKSTLGIVSGRERLGYFGYIQVSTPLNPGNSGGPALNTEGEVIGINAQGVPSAQNVGYIIPINEVKSALQDLRKVKLLRKPTLGCIFTWATPEMVKFLGNPDDGGWYIAKVFDNTLMKDVGVKEGDMLYEFNGHKVDIYGELDVPWSEDKVSLFEFLNRYKVGDVLQFLIYRKGKPVKFNFKLEDKYLPPVRNIYPEFEKEATDYEVFGGMILMNLTLNHVGIMLSSVPTLVNYGRSEKQHEPALLMTHILPNSQAFKARVLMPGSIIEEVNGEKVKSLADFRRIVLRDKKTGHVTVKTDEQLYAVLSLEKILKDEEVLPARYFYEKSKLVEQLSDAKKEVKEK
ncbi:MAG: trypsin-like peptidase domain-containing protein [bacterium]